MASASRYHLLILSRQRLLVSALVALNAVGFAHAQRVAPSGGLEEVIVTAQRRAESLQRAAVPVTALSSETLDRVGLTDPVNLSKLVPALTVQPTGLSSSFYIRGVGAASLNSFQENAVAFNVGGVYLARPTAPAGNFFDLERIEVVKGPQGILYGRNATAGAVNLIPKRPDRDAVGGDLTVELGNYDLQRFAGALNLPLGDIAALRVAGQSVDRDGYLSDGYMDEEGYALRASLLVEPSDRLSILLVGDYYHQDGKGMGSVLFPSPQTPNAPSPDRFIGSADPRITALLNQRTFDVYGNHPVFGSMPPDVIRDLVYHPRQDGFQDSDFWGLSSTIDVELGAGTLTVVAAYRSSKPDLLTYAPGFPGRMKEDNEQASLEVRFASDESRAFRYVVGAFSFYEEQDIYNHFAQGLLASTEYLPHLETESNAVFGQLTLDLSSRLRLVAGARYTREEKTMEGSTRNRSLFVPDGPYVPVDGDLSFNELTWKAGVEYDIGEQSLLFADVSTGFKAGGFYPSAGTNTFEPETLLAYTIGSKNRFLDNRLQLNVELFYWLYEDQQITYVGPVESTPGNFAQAGVTVNAGEARMYGLDAEVLFAPTPADTFSLAVQLLDAEYDDLVYDAISSGGGPLLTNCDFANDHRRSAAPPAQLFIVDCSGQSGINAPDWTVNIGYEHTFELAAGLELTAGVHSRLEASAHINFDYLDWQERDSYTTTDAFVSLSRPSNGWRLTAYVNNIENDAVPAGGLTRPLINSSPLAVRPPRTYGLRASMTF